MELNPAASLGEFFQFLQCQLRMELRQHCKIELEFADPAVGEIWPEMETFIASNSGASEKWVPYHTVLGVHELFLVKSIHSRKNWSEYQRFVAMFVFRAHCKGDLFKKVQLPILQKSSFWKDPKKAFMPGNAMEKSILAYRRSTGAPLQTSAYRCIPPRVLADNDKNLVRHITDRSMKLIQTAENAWRVLKSSRSTPARKMIQISKLCKEPTGFGDTTAKMLTCSIDLAYPEKHLLDEQCDVGVGAASILPCMLPGAASGDNARDLNNLLRVLNASQSDHAPHFWAYLKEAENHVREKFRSASLVCAQANTDHGCMSACTLQVQLCEYRQYKDFQQRRSQKRSKVTNAEADHCYSTTQKRKRTAMNVRPVEVIDLRQLL